MTIAADKPAEIQLTEHDEIIGDGDTETSKDHFLPWAISTDFHMYPTTPVLVRVYKPGNRAMIRLGAYAADLAIYLKADQIDRLINVLTAARQRLH